MKNAFFTISGFSDEISPVLDTQLEALDRIGVDFIEIRRADGINIADIPTDTAVEMASRIRAAGKKISSLGSPIGKIAIDGDIEGHFAKFRHCLELAEVFEAKYIRMFSFYPAADGDIVSRRDDVMRLWERFLKEAEGTGVTLLHENEKGIYGDIPERCLDLARTLGVDLIFDPANFIQCGADTLEGFKLLRPYIKYMHIKDALAESGRVVPSGMGNGHLPEIIAGLAEDGFNGYLSLEPHLGNFEGFSELEPDSPFASLPPSGERSYAIAADALKKILLKGGYSFK
ncbi:MAG: sugar phosphate isomerase/epimerase [Clostridia bacterium]|nr:sugar phosphate isomerase/epimerase [Clostridia bacterium]